MHSWKDRKTLFQIAQRSTYAAPTMRPTLESKTDRLAVRNYVGLTVVVAVVLRRFGLGLGVRHDVKGDRSNVPQPESGSGAEAVTQVAGR